MIIIASLFLYDATTIRSLTLILRDNYMLNLNMSRLLDYRLSLHKTPMAPGSKPINTNESLISSLLSLVKEKFPYYI